MTTTQILTEFLHESDQEISRYRKIRDLTESFIECTTMQQVTEVFTNDYRFIVKHNLQYLATNARRRIARISREQKKSYKSILN